MTAYFITATGTDIGKTFVTAGLARHLRGQGRALRVLKPVISGFDSAAIGESDSAILLRAAGESPTPDRIAAISPWRFHAPLSPDMAARREGRALDFEALLLFCRRTMTDNPGLTLIEGAGGVMSPLDDEHTMLDWMTALIAPVILVAGSYLGTISHSLSALAVLRQRGLAVPVVVVSETPDSAVGLGETVDTIARFAGGCPVIGLPRMDGETDDRAFARIAAFM